MLADPIATMVEPQCKRVKIEPVPAVQIKAILSDEFSRMPALVAVYVCTLAKKQDISKVIKELQELLPIPSLQHLKRVNQKQIIICQVKDLLHMDQMAEYLRKANLKKENIDLITKQVEIKYVAAAPSKLRWQFEAMQKHWPCKFHRNTYIEALYNNTIFTSQQKVFHQKMASLVMKLEQLEDGKRPMGVCIDPRNNSVVAIASSCAAKNPICHCAMQLVDNVARTQLGGAFRNVVDDSEFIECDITPTQEITLCGIPRHYYTAINADHDFKDLNFGAEVPRPPKKVDPSDDINDGHIDNLTKFGPYICTGYDVYLSQEPCLMCAMALIHSRIKRLFFLRKSNNGAVASCVKLQCAKELNHHYEVFHCCIGDECADNGDVVVR